MRLVPLQTEVLAAAEDLRELPPGERAELPEAPTAPRRSADVGRLPGAHRPRRPASAR